MPGLERDGVPVLVAARIDDARFRNAKDYLLDGTVPSWNGIEGHALPSPGPRNSLHGPAPMRGILVLSPAVRRGIIPARQVKIHPTRSWLLRQQPRCQLGNQDIGIHLQDG